MNKSRCQNLVIYLTAFSFVTLSVVAVCAAQKKRSSLNDSLVWDQEAEVTPRRKLKRKPNPKRNPDRKIERTTLLTVQYLLLKRRPDGKQSEVSPVAQISTGDQLRLSVTANQEGYLYVIHQYEGEDGRILFPDTRINDGGNLVAKDREFLLPPINCGASSSDLADCWYQVKPSPKKEYFVVVFSRDLILDLPYDAVQTGLSGGTVKKELIEDYAKSVDPQKSYLIRGRPRNARGGAGASPYAVWVTNVNKQDNEEIVLRVPLNKGL